MGCDNRIFIGRRTIQWVQWNIILSLKWGTIFEWCAYQNVYFHLVLNTPLLSIVVSNSFFSIKRQSTLFLFLFYAKVLIRNKMKKIVIICSLFWNFSPFSEEIEERTANLIKLSVCQRRCMYISLLKWNNHDEPHVDLHSGIPK